MVVFIETVPIQGRKKNVEKFQGLHYLLTTRKRHTNENRNSHRIYNLCCYDSDTVSWCYSYTHSCWTCTYMYSPIELITHDQTNYVLQTNYTILRQLLPLHTRKATTYKNLSITSISKDKSINQHTSCDWVKNSPLVSYDPWQFEPSKLTSGVVKSSGSSVSSCVQSSVH